MERFEKCPSCNSPHLKILKEYVFKYPGNDIKSNLHDIIYERLWILFRKILKTKNNALFYAMMCESCKLIYLVPRCSEDEIAIKYKTINELGGVKYRLKNYNQRHVETRANRIYELINKFMNYTQTPMPKILDFGGASGYILRPFINRFKCHIIDFEKWELPDGIEYLGTNLSSLNKTDRFDVILLLHTLEHIVHPKKFLEDLCRYLDDDGMIYIEVPLGCFKEWQYVEEPLTHINFYSEESIYKCLESCGLETIYIGTAYQQVVRAKMWCINVLATKAKIDAPLKISDMLSTHKQMSKINYYIPYLFNRRAIRKMARKVVGI